MIITGKENINKFRLLTIRSGLRLEIKTGMRHSRNLVFNAAKQITGKKTRKACLEEIEKQIATFQ